MSGNSINQEGAKLAQAQKEAADYAYKTVQAEFDAPKTNIFGLSTRMGSDPVDGPMTHYEILQKHTRLDTGGMAVKNTKTGKVYLVLHGKESGVKTTESGFQVNALDDESVRLAAFNTTDNTPKLYPALDKQARDLVAEYGAEVETVNYSNGNVKGSYLNRTQDIPGTSFDGMAGPRQVLDMLHGSNAPMEHITTDRLSVLDPATTVTEMLGGYGKNVKVQTVPSQEGITKALPKVDRYVMGNHDIYGAFDEHSTREPMKSSGRVFTENLGRSTGLGLATGYISEKIVNKVMPDSPEQAKMATGAVTTSALTKLASPALGLGAAPIAETLLPIYASYETASATSQAVYDALPQEMNNREKGAIVGGTAGGVGAATFIATASVQQAIMSGLSSAPTSLGTGAAVTEGVEMASLAGAGTGAGVGAAGAAAVTEGVEMTSMAALEGGLTTATEVLGASAGAQAGLDIPNDIAFGVVASITTAVMVTAAIGAIFAPENPKRPQKTVFALLPSWNETNDQKIGGDAQIMRLVNGLTTSASKEDIDKTKTAIENRAVELGYEGYKARFQEVLDVRDVKDYKYDWESSTGYHPNHHVVLDAPENYYENIRNNIRIRQEQSVELQRQENRKNFKEKTPEIGSSVDERFNWLKIQYDKNPQYWDDDFLKAQTNTEDTIQAVVLRQNQKQEKTKNMYQTIQNDERYKLTFSARDISGINASIREVVKGAGDQYKNIDIPLMNPEGDWVTGGNRVENIDENIAEIHEGQSVRQIHA